MSFRRGFTTIELLCVMAVAAILLGIALASSIHWGRGTAVRAAVSGTRSSLGLARRWAVTHRTGTDWHCGNSAAGDRGFCVIRPGSAGMLGNTNFLPSGILFSTGSTGTITFTSDGSCFTSNSAWSGDTMEIVLADRELPGGISASTVILYRVTGYCRTR